MKLSDIYFDDRELHDMGQEYDWACAKERIATGLEPSFALKNALACRIVLASTCAKRHSELVEARGNAPRTAILQGSPVPCTAPSFNGAKGVNRTPDASLFRTPLYR